MVDVYRETPGLHWTPTHARMLRQVSEKQIEWRQDMGAYGRFCRLGGQAVSSPNELVALYELQRAHLIHQSGAVVAITVAGEARLGGQR